jgi:hypothetical protein
VAPEGLVALPHVMSSGHSDAFELAVHLRMQVPPFAMDGTLAQVVSDQPGSSGQMAVHGIEQIPGARVVAPRHVVPLPHSLLSRQ